MTSAGEIWLTDFGEPAHREPADLRPAVVVGHTEQFGERFPYVLLVPTTSTRRELDLHVEIEPEPITGLDQPSYAQCELLRSVGKTRLVHRLGFATGDTMRAIDRRLRMLLDH